MTPTSLQSVNISSRRFGPAAALALALAVVFTVAIVAMPAAQAQTFAVIHTFTGGQDGSGPYADLTIDAAGNVYGTTSSTGGSGAGTVFRVQYSVGTWVLNTLYSFSGDDGAFPYGGVTVAPNGTLYSTTSAGGGIRCGDPFGCGTVFQLRPPPTAPRTALFPWSETILYRFTGGSDGANPSGNVILDEAGDIYGVTADGGDANYGVIYELARTRGGWTETVLYSAQSNGDGAVPQGGVVFDRSGNLYGVFALNGPYDRGAVYELSPSGSGWTEHTVYDFTGGADGSIPDGQLIIDRSGSLYGTTSSGGRDAGGTAFEITPDNGGWSFSTLYGFFCVPWLGPCGGSAAKVVMDGAGNLYGTTVYGGAYERGSVFKLTPSSGGWSYKSLHDFTGGSDGGNPYGGVTIDANGHIYGTTVFGGQTPWPNGHGVVFEITP